MPETRVVRSVDEIEPGSWDALADSVLVSHGWLKTIEACYPAAARSWYVTVHDRGNLVGAATCHVATADGGFALDDIVFGKHKQRAARIGLSFLPYLHCGSYAGYGDPLLVDASLTPSERHGVGTRLLDALEQLAAAERLPLYFGNLVDDGTAPAARLAARGYRVSEVSPVCFLELEWDSFQGYLDHLRKSSRNMSRAVVKEIRRSEKAGVRIERVAGPGDHEARMHEMADDHWRWHNNRPFPFRHGFFAQAHANLGDRLLLYGAFKAERLVGFSMLVGDRGVRWGLEVGIDDAHRREDAIYFNLCYYRPVADAIEEGARRVYFGRGLPRVKLRRGCRTA